MHYAINDIIGPRYGGEQCTADVVITRETCAEGIYYRVRKTVGKGDWFSVTSFGKR